MRLFELNIFEVQDQEKLGFDVSFQGSSELQTDLDQICAWLLGSANY